MLFALALQPALQSAQTVPATQTPPLTMAYLDDVCLAGDYRVVSAALGRLTAAARQVGLRITPSKCELIPCGGADAAVDPRAFPQGVQINCSGSFTLLGASIGSVAFCEQHTLKERGHQSPAPSLGSS